MQQNTTDPSGSREERSELQRYYDILVKRKLVVISGAALVIGAVAMWTFFETPIYMARATVLVDQRAPQVLGKEVGEVVDLSAGSAWRTREYLETQHKVITSARVSRRVVDKLGLLKDPKFWGPEKREKEPTAEDATRALQSMITARRVLNSDIIEIAVAHADRELAARLANAIAQTYLDQNVEYKLSSATGASSWLADQLDTLKKQLEQAELALYHFKKKNNTIAVSLENRQNLLASRITKLNDALTDARLKRLTLEAQRKQILAVRGKDPLKVSVSSLSRRAAIEALKANYVVELRKLNGLRARYLERHPLVLEQQARTDTARNALADEIRANFAGVESLYRETLDTERKLAGALQVAKNDALALNLREVEYQRLRRQQQNLSKLHSLILARMKESDLSAQLRVNNIRSLDRATVPLGPIKPRVKLNLLVGGLLGILFGIGLALLVDSLDQSVKSHDDIESIPHLLYLGLMPRIPGVEVKKKGRRPDPRPEVDLIVHRNPKSSVAESCRAIRTNLMFSSPDQPMKSFVVTSPGPREGKTTTVVSLAITMAQPGSRVLLVDTDMRRPRLHKVFGLSNQRGGVTSLLLGETSIEEAALATEVPNLYLLPCGPTPPNPAEICQSDRFRSMVAQLRDHFDLVLMDSPPAIVVTDSVIISTIVDGTLLVARSGYTSRAALRESARQIFDVGGHIAGCIVNDMDLHKRAYGYQRYRRYGYYRYGSYRYGQYYGNYGESEKGTAG